MRDPEAIGRLSRAGVLAIIALIFVGLVFTVVNLPPEPAGLAEEVQEELVKTGVRNAVTATLLNFRGYDTLLEIAVLMLAAASIHALRRGGLTPMRPAGEILGFLARVLGPTMVLIAGYLLWSGSDAPGGAFQAGAILGAAGVLFILAGVRLPWQIDGLPQRVGLAIGLAGFIGAGVVALIATDAFLGYPVRRAASIILLLEIGASISIGLTLLDMFVSVLRAGDSRRTPAGRVDR